MLLNRLLRPRPPATNRTKAETPANGWWQPFVQSGLASNTSASGEVIGPQTALGYHAWYRAISLIAQKCAAIPKHVYRWMSNDPDSKERAREHPVYRLVHERANSEQTAFQFWLQMAGHVPSRGNGYAVIYKAGGKTELIPLDPDRTHPVRKDGALWYVAFPFGYQGDGYRFRPEEILHFRGFGFDGLVGHAVWKVAADEIGLGKAERRFTANRYRNNARPSLVLQTDMKLNDAAKTRLRDDWERMHQGVDNAGRTALLDQGIKAQPISLSSQELQQSGAAQISLAAISNYTGVPSSKLSASGKSFASQEQEDQAFINDGLDFYLNVFEDETSAKLFTEDERAEGYEVKANRQALLRPAVKDQLDALRTATGGKPVMTQNEARKILDMPKSDEPDADKLLTPLNMGQGGASNRPNAPDGNEPGRPSNDGNTAARNAAASALSHATKKLVKRVGFHANRHARDGAKFMEFLGSIRADHEKVFQLEFAAAEEAARAANASRKPAAGEAACFLIEVMEHEFTTISGEATAKTLQAKVAALVSDQELRLPKDFVHIFLEDAHA